MIWFSASGCRHYTIFGFENSSLFNSYMRMYSPNKGESHLQSVKIDGLARLFDTFATCCTLILDQNKGS